MIRPLHDNILVRRIDGHGIETVSEGGIIIPATAEKSVRTKRDYFRARVEAMGSEVRMPDLAIGDEVFVHTWSGTAESLYTGREAVGAGLIIKPDDIICAVEAA